ncbi:hypothetical protein FS749_007328, partial [Ceratobasidium sp. UAMH 11750]
MFQLSGAADFGQTSQVDTDFKWKDTATTIKHATGQELARIEWKIPTLKEETVTMNGKTMLLSELMPETGKFLSFDRTFKASTGRELLWVMQWTQNC